MCPSAAVRVVTAAIIATFLTTSCRPVPESRISSSLAESPARSRFAALHEATTRLEAVAAGTRTASAILEAWTDAMHRYLLASDWSKTAQEQAILEAYWDALEQMRQAQINLSNREAHDRQIENMRTEAAAMRLAEQANKFSRQAADEIRLSTEKFRRASKLCVEYLNADSGLKR